MDNKKMNNFDQKQLQEEAARQQRRIEWEIEQEKNKDGGNPPKKQNFTDNSPNLE